MDNEELKPCPFCGVEMFETSGVFGHRTTLDPCPIAHLQFYAASDAAAWNTRTTPTDGLREDETGWLIEEDAGGVIHWIALTENIWKLGWYISDRDQPSPVRRVKDSNEALRFARREDAEAFVSLFDRFLLCPKVTEHAWIDAARTTPTDGLREALKPFADLGSCEVAEQFTDGVVWILTNGERRFGAVSMGDLRRAAAALATPAVPDEPTVSIERVLLNNLGLLSAAYGSAGGGEACRVVAERIAEALRKTVPTEALAELRDGVESARQTILVALGGYRDDMPKVSVGAFQMSARILEAQIAKLDEALATARQKDI